MAVQRGMLEKSVQYLIKTFYLGGRYAGSQFQVDEHTIEGKIIDVLVKSKYIESREANHFKRASRTDAGVHARSNLFSFESSKVIHPIEINAQLPEDIGIWAYAILSEPKNPRYLPISREYRYYYPVYFLPKVFNEDLVREALEMLKGTHDFKYLCKLEKDKDKDKTTVRTFYDCECVRDEVFLKFRFEGDSFLWNQIRKTVQLLLDIGNSLVPISDLPDILKADPRFEKQIFGNADPNGLILWDLKLPPEIESQFKTESKSLEKFAERLSVQTFDRLIQAKFQSEILESLGKEKLF